MDKYEFNIKLDQIKKYAAKKDYKSASRIARDMDWRKIKDWSSMSSAIDIHEAAGDLDEARDMAILAYNKNLGGRKLVYKLTELFIKLREFDDAEELYEEYESISQHDVNRYVLLYELKKAEGVTTSELIEILEEYKSHDLDEKYLHELAVLYSKSGKAEKCVKQCDQIMLLFQDGKYAEDTIKLKKKYTKITAAEQKVLAKAQKRPEEDLTLTKELMFKKEKERAKLEEDEIEAIFVEDDIAHSAELPERAERESGDAPNTEQLEQHSSNIRLQEDGPAIDLIQNEADADVQNAFKSLIRKASGQEEESVAQRDSEYTDSIGILERSEADTDESFGDDDSEFFQVSSGETAKSIEKAGQSLRELIESARRKVESNYEQVKHEDEAERLQEAVSNMEVPVADYNLYDTQNIQKELAKNLGELFDDESSQTFKPSPILSTSDVATDNMSSGIESSDESHVDEQIDGQLNIEDWIQLVREEKYGKQNTKEYSKAELERLLDERENEKEAYEKLLEKQRKLAEDKGEVYDEEEASRKAFEQMILQAAKTDLAIRTGKATAKLEAVVENLKEAAMLAAEFENDSTVTLESLEVAEAIDSSDIFRIRAEKDRSEAEAASSEEKHDEHVIPFKRGDSSFNIYDQIAERESEELQKAEEYLEEAPEENHDSAFNNQEEDSEDSDMAQEQIYEDFYETDEYEEEENEEEENQKPQIPKEVRKYFKKYIEMAGIDEQLGEYFSICSDEVKMKTSTRGNIIISGNRSSDKTNLAVSIVKALNALYPQYPKKIAKTTGESINHKGLTKAMAKLKGTALIVEDAGVIEPRRISEILNVLDQETDGMLVIFEDADTAMNILISVNPEITTKFNHRIVLKQYSVNELVEMAKKYAGKRQHDIDDNALLQLYLKIDKLHSQNDSVRLDQIKEIIDKAIFRAEKRASRKLFGSVKKRRGENGDIYLLAESDFKD